MTNYNKRRTPVVVAASKFLLMLILAIMQVACAMVETRHLEISSYLIVPGRSIGPISIGMDNDEVMRILGPPSKVFIMSKGRSLQYIWRSGGPLILGVEFGEDFAPKVLQVWTKDPRFATKKGIHVGNSTKDVVRILGSPKRMRGFQAIYCGLEFVPTESNIVDSITAVNGQSECNN